MILGLIVVKLPLGYNLPDGGGDGIIVTEYAALQLSAGNGLLDYDFAVEPERELDRFLEAAFIRDLGDSYAAAAIGGFHEAGVACLGRDPGSDLLRLGLPVATANDDEAGHREAGIAEDALHGGLIHADGAGE